MDWKPIAKEEFLLILDEEIAELEPEHRLLYEAYRVPVFSQQAIRPYSPDIENVFVVARRGNRVIFYDDVEDEFGVVELSEGMPLKLNGTFGPLVAALRQLERGERLIQ